MAGITRTYLVRRFVFILLVAPIVVRVEFYFLEFDVKYTLLNLLSIFYHDQKYFQFWIGTLKYYSRIQNKIT